MSTSMCYICSALGPCLSAVEMPNPDHGTCFSIIPDQGFYMFRSSQVRLYFRQYVILLTNYIIHSKILPSNRMLFVYAVAFNVVCSPSLSSRRRRSGLVHRPQLSESFQFHEGTPKFSKSSSSVQIIKVRCQYSATRRGGGGVTESAR
jgi:hypothetical protein